MLDTILVPIDDSSIVRSLLKKLPSIMDISGKNIYLLHVSEPYPPNIYSESALSEYYISDKKHKEYSHELAKKLFDKLSKYLSKSKKVSLVHIFDDDIAHGILMSAKKHKVDIIAMTSHRYLGLKNIVLGDNVHKVIVNSKIPVLVI